MIKRTIEISQEPAYLATKHGQLQIRRGDNLVGSIPCEDIGVVLVDHPQTQYSHSALTQLAEFNAAVVLCGRNHLPVAVLLPVSHHSNVVWRLRDQIAVGRPLSKQLWQQLIRAKIRASASNLEVGSPAKSKLLELARQVRSGDPTNIEALAARIYWQNWLKSDISFRRDVEGDGLNSLLNYGYAVIRAAIARALVAAGLTPALGIKHANRGNAFALADDLVEPLRFLVDERVRELFYQGFLELGPESKAGLLKLLAEDLQLGSESGPMMVCLHRYIASLVKCYQGEAKKLLIPERLKSASTTNQEKLV
jgi:CRISPR-associated protein Cas1